MFATLRPGDEPGELRAIELSDTLPVPGQGIQHFACHECRQRKLKCTGEKAGCSRCVAAGHECQYPANKTSKRPGHSTKRSSHDLSTTSRSRQSSGLTSSHSNRRSPTSRSGHSGRAETEARRPQAEPPSSELSFVPPVARMTDDNALNEPLFASPAILSRSDSGDPLQDLTELLDNSAMRRFDGLDETIDGALDDIGLDPFQFESFNDTSAFDEFFSFTPDPAAVSDAGPTLSDSMVRTELGNVTSHVSWQPAPPLTPDTSVSAGSQPSLTPKRGSSTTVPRVKSHDDARSTPLPPSEVALNPPHSEARCMKVACLLSYTSHFCPRPAPAPTASTLFKLLSDFRQCVQMLSMLVTCKRCTSSPEFTTLLADICERLARGFVTMTAMASQVTIDAMQSDQLLTSGYAVDSQEEFAALFGMLAVRQLNLFRQTAAKPRARAAVEGWQKTLLILRQVDARLQGIEDQLNPKVDTLMMESNVDMDML